jgi:hypothetical protein
MAKKKKFEPGRDLYNELRAARAKATPNPTLGIAALALFAPINGSGYFYGESVTFMFKHRKFWIKQ